MVDFNNNLNLNTNFNIGRVSGGSTASRGGKAEGTSLLAGKSGGDSVSFSTKKPPEETEAPATDKHTNGIFGKIGNFFKKIGEAIGDLFKPGDNKDSGKGKDNDGDRISVIDAEMYYIDETGKKVIIAKR